MPSTLILAALAAAVPGADTTPAKAHVVIRGVHCDADVAVLRKALKAVPGVSFDTEKVTVGQKRRYFSEPFPVAIADTRKTNIGALAKAIGEAETPHRDDVPPKLNLVLFTDEAITEQRVMDLRSALTPANGVEVQVSGGLGGMPGKGFYWIQLETAGGAVLVDVFKEAQKSGVRLALEPFE